MLIFLYLCTGKRNTIHAKDGYIDLSAENFSHTSYALDGSWEFYRDIYCDSFSQKPDYINVPKGWNAHENEELHMPVFGKATYRLRIKLPKQGYYMFHIPYVSSSYELYVNDSCIASSGRLERDGCKEKNQWKAQNAVYYADTEMLDLVLYTSNYHGTDGGIIYSIILGTYDHISRDTFIQITRSAIFMGLLLGFGLYLILLYKKKINTTCLYVGIACLGCMVLEGFIGSYITCFLFPYIEFSTMIRVQYISFEVVMIMFLLTGKEQYPNQQIKYAGQVLLGINLTILILLLLPTQLGNHIMSSIKYVLLGINISYVLFVMVRATIARVKYAFLSTISFLALLIAIMIDVLGIIRPPSAFSKSGIYVIGIVIFFCTQLYILSRKSVDIYEQAARAKDMEIAYLQAQIAPHFFFNTLNNIYTLSTQNIKDAQKLLLAFCSFLKTKYLFDYRKNITCTLEHELRILSSFIEIENFRFQDRIHFETRIDQQYRSITVPQLILQPLVENAIKHGFENKDLTICVSCDKVDDILCITVHDDGRGMGKGYASSLLTSQTKGVGLKNVAHRIQKYYGTNIEISSSLGVGTDITLYIPLNKKLEVHHESCYR